jgi:hypothetical protein
MAKNKAAKRSVSKQGKPPKAAKAVKVTRSGKAVTISFSKPEEAITHLLSLASDFAGKHFDKASFTAAADDVLGTAAARDIVSGCANSDCWNCTLGDLKLDSDLFQSCVFNGVQQKGYSINRNDIPASQSTQLYTVVMAIQNAPKKAGP